MDQFEPYNEKLGRRPVGPRIADQQLAAGPPIAPSQMKPSYSHGPSAEEIVPDADNPLSGWRGLGLAIMHPSLWQGQGRHNPLVAYFAGRRRGRHWEDFIGLSPWLFAAGVYSVYSLQPSVGPMQMTSVGLVAIVVLPMLALVSTSTCISMHMRRNLRVLPLQELLLTRLRPQEIVLGLAVRPIAIQNVGLLCYILWTAALMVAKPLMGWQTPSLADAFVIVVILSCQYFLSSILIEFAAGAALRANLFIRGAFSAWARGLFDAMISASPMLLVLALFIGCGWTWISGAFIVLGLLFLLVALGRAVLSWVQEYAWDPIYWSVRYVSEWWVFQGAGGIAGDVPERTMLTEWRPLAIRAGFASRVGRRL